MIVVFDKNVSFFTCTLHVLDRPKKTCLSILTDTQLHFRFIVTDCYYQSVEYRTHCNVISRCNPPSLVSAYRCFQFLFFSLSSISTSGLRSPQFFAMVGEQSFFHHFFFPFHFQFFLWKLLVCF